MTAASSPLRVRCTHCGKRTGFRKARVHEIDGDLSVLCPSCEAIWRGCVTLHRMVQLGEVGDQISFELFMRITESSQIDGAKR